MPNYPESEFDKAFAMASEAEEATMGVQVTVNGMLAVGIVDPIDISLVRKVGMNVATYETSLYLNRDCFIDSGIQKDGTVKIGARTLRVMSLQDLGGAGVRLDLEQPNQRRVTVPGL
jgi:hypothetical protein